MGPLITLSIVYLVLYFVNACKDLCHCLGFQYISGCVMFLMTYSSANLFSAFVVLIAAVHSSNFLSICSIIFYALQNFTTSHFLLMLSLFPKAPSISLSDYASIRFYKSSSDILFSQPLLSFVSLCISLYLDIS